MTGRVTGRCHCGEVQVSVISAPAEVTECHCSICRRYAPLWTYYQTGDVLLSGPTDIYRWGRQHIDFHRCHQCGCVMAWMPRGDYPECGINARMLDGFDLSAVSLIVEEDSSV